MEIKITTQQILKVLAILAWIIFIGLCVEAGGVISNAFYTLVLNPQGAASFWPKLDLSSLYQYDAGHFLVETLLMSIAAVMKALLFYLIVRILSNKKLDMSQPFVQEVGRFVFNLSYLSLGIGIFSRWCVENTQWLVKQGVTMPDVTQLNVDGADVWLFMGVILFIIAQIFKRGIEIQSEHELTV